MFRDLSFPWVLPAAALFVTVPHPATFVLLGFALFHFVMGVLRSGR